MEKFISRKAHGVIEAAYIPMMAVAPEVFDFNDEKTAKLLCRVQAGGGLLSSMLTRAEWGLVKLVPFKTHLMIDVGMGVFSLAAPWFFGFSKNTKARNAFVAMGASALLVAAFTEPEEMLVSE